MTHRQIASHRLHTHRLSGRPVPDLHDVVAWLGAIQSQEYAVAKWSIGQRARGVTDEAIERALTAGTMVRTHVLRPTWHFVLPADIRWMLELTAPRIKAMMASYNRKLGLDEGLFTRSRKAIVKALKGGGQLTRKEITSRLRAAGIAADSQRVGHLLMDAELDAVICSGALEGKQRTYALFDERVPPTRRLSRDEALAELTRRYFTSHGPATLKDYQWWSSLTAADARRGLEIGGADLDRLVAGDRTYWLAGSPRRSKAASPAAHLLQGYDEYVVAYSESRDAILHAGVSRTVPPFTHAIVLDGQVVGHWKQVLTTKGVAIETQLPGSLTRVQRDAIGEAAVRYGRFVGLPVTLR